MYESKLDVIFRKVLVIAFSGKQPKDIIVIESHSDFDCNGGAFYEYLIANGFNRKYKIVWLLHNPKFAPGVLPDNVVCVPFNKPNLKKDYYMCRAKILTNDDAFPEKLGKNQTMYYLTHGGCTFKNVKGLLNIPEHINYILTSSEAYYELECNNFSVPYPNNRMLCVGYPSNDYLFRDNRSELSKITNADFDKVILWMPTFRKLNSGRVDGTNSEPLGIPLLESLEEYERLNAFLSKNNTLLLIKIHPYQDMSGFSLPSLSNIEVLTPERVKKINVDNYKLMSVSDALISDYSSAAYSFILLNRPIGFVLSDLEDYKIGFSVEDYNSVLPGEHINDFSQFISFIDGVICGKDEFRYEREKLCDWLYNYRDGDSCKRLVDFMKI